MVRTKDAPDKKVLAFIKENNLAGGGEKVAVAVSGGPDSVCLLHILNGLHKELDIELHVAHLNHQLRGEESEADARYVRSLAKRLGIPATVESRDVKAYRKQHRISLEEAAREVRYSFLAEAAEAAGATKVAVGHTADDHIETVLMHLMRGSGIKGLRGLMPLNKLNIPGGSITIIRPLLSVSREETSAYCRAHKLKPRRDATNLKTDLMRNKVRLKLLPELRQYNPQIAQALLRLAHTAADDLNYIEKEARRLTDGVIKADKGSVTIKKKAFNALPPAIKRQLLRFSIERLLGSLKDIEAGHIEEIMGALEKPAGRVIGLPFGINFTIEYDRYILAAETASCCPLPALRGEIELKIPGKTALGGWEIDAAILKRGEVKGMGGEANDFTACLDGDRAGKKISVRARLPGDRFQPLGMGQVKRLNVFMIDAKVPRAWRQRVPIVCCGGKILWIAGWRIDECYKVTPDTKNVLRLEFRRV